MRLWTHLVLVSLPLSAVHAAAEQRPFSFSAGRTANGGTFITPELSTRVEEWMDELGVKGLTLGVVHVDSENEYGAWGIKTEDGDPMTPETVFNIGSCSKAFVASSVGLLMVDYAQGKNTTPLPAGLDAFNWLSKVRDVLPGEFKLKDEWADQKVSMRDILTHMSGLTRHDFAYSQDEPLTELVHRLRYLDPNWEIREQWHYNNQMFSTAGYIMDKYAGSYEDYIQAHIWDPLNMTSTTLWPKPPALSQTWAANGRRIPYWLDDASAQRLISGAGGIASNVIDMSNWIEMHLRSGANPLAGKHVLPSSVFEMTTSAHSLVSDSPDQPTITYGLGWMQTSILGQKVITHGGAIPGFKTFVAFLPDAEIGIVSLTNTDSGSEVQSKIAAEILAMVALGLGDETASGSKKALEQLSSFVSPPKRTAALWLPTEEIDVAPEDLSIYSGTYGHPAYGSFTICDPSSTSFYCVGVHSDFDSVEKPDTSTAQLLVKWPRFWTTHIRLTHENGHRFKYTPMYLFTHGYGADMSPFSTGSDEGGYAEFVVDSEGKVHGLKLIDELDARVLGREEEVQSVFFSKVY